MSGLLGYVVPVGAPSCAGSCTRGGAGRSGRRDNVAAPDIAAALDGLTSSTGECAENVEHAEGTPCATKKVTDLIAQFVVEVKGRGAAPAAKLGRAAAPKRSAAPSGDLLPSADTPAAEAVRDAAAVLGCASESAVVGHHSLREFIVRHGVSPKDLDLELEIRYKAPGPRDSLALLSNFNIDETLRRWARVFPEFYPCPFAMMDFDRNGDLFGAVDLAAVMRGREVADLGPGVGRVRRRSDTFGCVVNTDTSSGPGKHWVAVFVDCRPGPGKPWTVEYFNSTGRAPPKQMVGWMERSRARLAAFRETLEECRDAVCEVESIPVTDMDHQKSDTECGLYALFYIRRRLEGTPYSFFVENRISDDAMTAFRKHVFRGGN